MSKLHRRQDRRRYKKALDCFVAPAIWSPALVGAGGFLPGMDDRRRDEIERDIRDHLEMETRENMERGMPDPRRGPRPCANLATRRG